MSGGEMTEEQRARLAAYGRVLCSSDCCAGCRCVTAAVRLPDGTEISRTATPNGTEAQAVDLLLAHLDTRPETTMGERTDEKTIKLPPAKRTWTVEEHDDGSITVLREDRGHPGATSTGIPAAQRGFGTKFHELVHLLVAPIP